MISRIVSCTIAPAKVSDFKAALNNEFLPRIQALPGFIENIESLDPASGQFSCVTVWKSQADVENYDKGLFQEVATAITPLLKDGPSIATLPVENSSVHNIKAGAAAA
ncbi:MAG TPA: hypothetical protein VFO34_02555 [Candidatus Acidoferrales bacterium]|nr:hypothetical protein [Candidatus Acidoferrales bacterium]